MILTRLKKTHFFLFLLAISLLPYFYLSFFAHPIADDLIYAHKGSTQPLIDALLQEYKYWSGRYTAMLFGFNNPINKSLILYQLIPIGLITLITAGAFILFKSILIAHNIKRLQLGIMSLLFTLTFIGQLPIISEGIYWYSGAVGYVLPIVPTLLYFSLIYKYLNGVWFLNRYIHVFGIFALQFFIMGFNEVHMLLMLLFQFVLAIIELNKKEKGIGMFLLLSGILFSSIMIFSPGNLGRSSHFFNNHDLINSVLSSLLQTIRFSTSWISSAPILLLSILYIPFHFKLEKTSALFQKSFYLKPYIAILLLMSTIFIAAFAPYWATGILGQHRTMNTAWFFFLLMWFVNLTVWCNHFKSTLGTFTIPIKFQCILYGLIWLTLSFTNNGYGAALDIFDGSAQRFDKLMSERYLIMEKARESKEKSIYFTPITDPPRTLFILDISKDPNFWINLTYPLYYGMPEKQVISKEP